jgi:hypothetical protein
MDISRACNIVQEMAKHRGTGILEILQEYDKYQVDGKCDHFWPDENTACRVFMNDARKMFTPVEKETV